MTRVKEVTVDLNRAQSRLSYKRFRPWGAHERGPCGFRDFALLRGRLGNRNPVDPKHFGGGDVPRNRHGKIPNERRNGTALAWCEPPQREQFLERLNRAITRSQEVPQRPASRRKAESSRAE